MKELSVKEIQQCDLEMLEFFDAFARKHKLTYFLSGGTLLGAVRHKGFIPWDDDADLMMPRPDYNKMLRLFSHKKYHLACCEKDSDYSSCHARIWDTRTVLEWGKGKAHEKSIGVHIDIFPIEGYPSSELMTKLHLYRVKFARAKVNMALREEYKENEKFIGLKNILSKMFSKSGNYYAQQLSRIAQSYDYQSCDYAGVCGANMPHLFKEKNPKSIYAKTVWLDFEHLKLPAPVGYDAYLKQLYGNYMELPPKDKRVSEHNFHVYWRNS